MPEPEPFDRALILLTSVVNGKTPVTWLPHNDWIFQTEEVFTTPDGTVITVFFDCGEADYVHRIVFPDEILVDYDQLYRCSWSPEGDRDLHPQNLDVLFPDPFLLYEPFFLAIESHGHKRPTP